MFVLLGKVGHPERKHLKPLLVQILLETFKHLRNFYPNGPHENTVLGFENLRI